MSQALTDELGEADAVLGGDHLSCLLGGKPLRDRKFADSPLEGDGFELQVPRQIGNALRLRSNVTDAAGQSGPSSQARLSRPP